MTRLREPQPAAAPPRVDAKDHELIAALENDGRAPAAALAAQVGLSDDAVRQRLRRLRETGVLRVLGYADLALRDLACFSMLALRIHGDVRPTIERLLEIEEIYWLACVDGRFDALAELTCRDTDHLFEVINAAIRSLPTIASSELFTYLETTKWADAPSVHLPLRHEPRASLPAADDIDRRLIEHLERDGRASFRDLAATADVSYDVARRRVTTMLESGVVTPVTVVDRSVTNRPVSRSSASESTAPSRPSSNESSRCPKCASPTSPPAPSTSSARLAVAMEPTSPKPWGHGCVKSRAWQSRKPSTSCESNARPQSGHRCPAFHSSGWRPGDDWRVRSARMVRWSPRCF